MRQVKESIRPPAVAGAFYPAEAAVLRQEVEALLAGAAPPAVRAKALVAPHAGYVYSGAVAASAYKVLEQAPKPTRVALLGPAHTVPLEGLALPAARALRTPLGEVPVDPELEARALRFPFVFEDARAHAREHSLEVQLPFLQEALGAFTVLPLCVGRARPAEVAEVLEAVWGGPETLLVVSTDLSHYLSWSQARRADAATLQAILALDPDAIEAEGACGAAPLAGLLLAARRRGLTPTVLDARNSGDTAGSRDRVVGYAAVAFSEAPS